MTLRPGEHHGPGHEPPSDDQHPLVRLTREALGSWSGTLRLGVLLVIVCVVLVGTIRMLPAELLTVLLHGPAR